MYSVSYNEFRQHVLSYLKRLRSTPLKASTSVNHGQDDQQDCCNLLVLHDAQRAHEFEADTAGANHAITVEARKLYSQR
ncbi:Uncharacterised protein [Klebsiella pneumoniae]|nr:Uncharacterised protein [Klebsiella pneumoniae]